MGCKVSKGGIYIKLDRFLAKNQHTPKNFVFCQMTYWLEFCTASNNGCQKIRQKIRQKISVIKTNSFDWELLTFDDSTKIVHFGILIHILP